VGSSDPMRHSRPIVEARSGGVCERCGVRRAESVHHRKLRRFDDHRAANLVHLCGSGTTGCHGWAHANPRDAAAEGFIVRSTNNPRIVPVKHGRYGWVRLADSGDVVPTKWTEKEKQ